MSTVFLLILCLALVKPAMTLSTVPRGSSTSRRPAGDGNVVTSRRSWFQGTAASLIASATGMAITTAGSSSANADTGAEVRGIGVTPFNSLIFQYRGSEYGGLTADEIDEPSIPYKDFIGRLKAGEVEFVEFMAPDRDAAYATLKQGKDHAGKSTIRIGEGYPIEKHDGWSSPAFVVRTVKDAGVPYKFSVPALRSFQQQ